MAKTGRPLDSVKHKYRMILEQSGAYNRYREILAKTKSDTDFLKAFELGEDRASGKPIQYNDNTNREDDDRPPIGELLETITALRKELDGLKQGDSVAAEKPADSVL